MAIKEMLGQHEEWKQYTIYFIRKNLAPAELHYTVMEKEFLVVVYSISKFHHYISSPIFIHIDHFAILFNEHTEYKW